MQKTCTELVFVYLYLQHLLQEDTEIREENNTFNSTINGSYRAVNPRSLFLHSTQSDEEESEHADDLPDLSPIRRSPDMDQVNPAGRVKIKKCFHLLLLFRT